MGWCDPLVIGWLLLTGIVAVVAYKATQSVLTGCFGKNINLSYIARDGTKQTRRIRVKPGE